MRQGLRRALQQLWRPARAGHCILVYHSVGDAPYSVPPARFREQMDELGRRLEIVPLPELLARRAPGSRRRAAITFDDGFQDNYTIAWPILRERNIAPVLFLASSFVGERSRLCTWSPHYRGAPSLTWKQVEEMAAQGAVIGAHTRSHPRLSDCTAEQCAEELTLGRFEIAQRLGRRIDLLAYPFGQPHDYTRETEAAVRKAGYRYAFTTLQRTLDDNDRPFALPRITIDAGDTMEDFVAKIEGRRNFMALVDHFRAATVRAGLRQPLALSCSRCLEAR